MHSTTQGIPQTFTEQCKGLLEMTGNFSKKVWYFIITNTWVLANAKIDDAKIKGGRRNDAWINWRRGHLVCSKQTPKPNRSFLCCASVHSSRQWLPCEPWISCCCTWLHQTSACRVGSAAKTRWTGDQILSTNSHLHLAFFCNRSRCQYEFSSTHISIDGHIFVWTKS